MKRIHLLLFVLYFAMIGLSAQCAALGQSLSTKRTAAGPPATPAITLPMREGSVRVAVFGDAGRGSREQYDLARVMEEYRQAFQFDLVLLTGVGSVFGQLGDLSESLLKRSRGVKDSGAILPGHGGLLDRVDAVLFVAPYFYLYALLRT